MAVLAEQAFLDEPSYGGLAAGVVIADAMAKNLSDFQQFARDLRAGLVYVGSAAQVIAQTYTDTDANAAQSISDVSFAFGDSGATRPTGYTGKVHRYSDDATQHAPLSIAQRGDVFPDDVAYELVPASPVDGSFKIVGYDDGSTRSTSVSLGPDGTLSGREGTVVTDRSGHPVSTYDRDAVVDNAGNHTVVTTDVAGQAGHSTVTKSVVVENPDGSAHIVVTRTTPDGKSQVTTLDEDSLTASPAQREQHNHG
jgi:hypothetical protein